MTVESDPAKLGLRDHAVLTPGQLREGLARGGWVAKRAVYVHLAIHPDRVAAAALPVCVRG
jgi:hypothetical protein